MKGYYEDRLSAERLKRCYEIAPPRVQEYLEAETEHVLRKTRAGDTVLELGCGYGRVLLKLARKAGWIFGIDTSLASLKLGLETLGRISKYTLLAMDAARLAFREGVFDGVFCVQNGISAFHVDPKRLIRESLRVVKPGGRVLFSSYSAKFWEDRLEWFELQAEAGLLGNIDYDRTGDGVIVCKDGFTATTVRPHEFLSFTAGLDVDARIEEVDESSVFCEIIPLKP